MSIHKLGSYGPAGGSSGSGQVDTDVRRRRHETGVRRVRVGQGGRAVPSALDAAAFLALVPRSMSWLKMQDLLYYAQGWHLVWDGEPLFADAIMATEAGVRIEAVDSLLRDNFAVTRVIGGQDTNLSESARQTLSGIVKFYGGKNHFRLSEAIVTEKPWLHAREAG